MNRWLLLTCSLLIAAPARGAYAASAAEREAPVNPYARQVAEQIAKLSSATPAVRAGAAEALGYLRAYSGAEALATALGDAVATVRREAAMSLGWCGGRRHVGTLLGRLDDADWTVRQAAWVALTNLTGMEFPYDALAEPDNREAQVKTWRDWWAAVPADRPPAELLARLPKPPSPPPPATPATKATNLARGCPVAASTTYKGPPAVLTDGRTRGGFWQTKAVALPQHCTVDLRQPRQVGLVVVHQHSKAFALTEYSISLSVDGKTYEQVHHRTGRTPVRLVARFAPRRARYVRITSHASTTKMYPTTFYEIQITAGGNPPGPWRSTAALPADPWPAERAVRALGALGGEGAVEAVLATLDAYAQRARRPGDKSLVQVALRSLGRLGGPAARGSLIEFLDEPPWARYAADALGDCGGEGAVAALIAAYPIYAKDARGRGPQQVPRDDRPGLDPGDRMYETPYAIAQALSRLPLERPADLAALEKIALLLAANLPSDWDGLVVYEPEAYELVTAYLLERAGWRRAACQAALRALGQPLAGPPSDREGALAARAKRYEGDVPYAAVWLTALCRDREHIPALLALLTHDNGWVRINAAKTLMFIGDKSTVKPIAKILADSKREADYGYFGGFRFASAMVGHGEYNDPAPRWREAFVRAVGRLGSAEHAGLLAKILDDERNVLEVRHAAARALDELGTSDAIKALRRAEAGHAFHSVRMVAREALWRRGLLTGRAATPARAPRTARADAKRAGNTSPPGEIPAIVFIKGPKRMPNLTQIDQYRQTYSVTDPGPTYRLGDNLHVLRPGRPGGGVTPLTHFADGFVADCEVSWDGRKVLFAHRGGPTDPWWHIWEIGADGTGLRQITRGPYHDVQPAYLPDGRIVFSSSRIGSRDEYHGYPTTGLTVMNADGSDIHCIGFNFGRDNEPAILPDGRILFSRLELFYSRLKTEITLQAAYPDGTHNVTLYGPERRMFWAGVTRASGERDWGEAAPRHRVLRLTQGQPYAPGQWLCATTGGLTVIGPGRLREAFLPHDKQLAVTSPLPLGDGRILCAAAAKSRILSRVAVSPRFKAGDPDPDLGLYLMDAATGAMTLLYNDPATAEFEPRPLRPRPRPAVLPADPLARSGAYTGTLFCSSARISREPRVSERGKLVRVIEGLPPVTRYHTHTSKAGPAWKNHAGTQARVLGTVPLAADGSFYVEVPADRMIHLQVLDSDRRVMGNQLIWMYVRPGERKSCVGCHEPPDGTALPPARPRAMNITPLPCLPTGGEFTYGAKLWNKGRLSDEGEERTRTVRAINLIGRQ